MKKTLTTATSDGDIRHKSITWHGHMMDAPVILKRGGKGTILMRTQANERLPVPLEGSKPGTYVYALPGGGSFEV